MQTKPLSRLSRAIFRSLLILIALVASKFLLFVAFILLMQSNKQLRAKVVKRLNPVTLSIAGKRRSPFGLLLHNGRRSGRVYETPLRAVPFGDGFALGLTYGADVDWCRNVFAAGECILKWHGQEHMLERPEIIPSARALADYTALFRFVMGKAVKEYLWVHRPGATAVRAGREEENVSVS